MDGEFINRSEVCTRLSNCLSIYLSYGLTLALLCEPREEKKVEDFIFGSSGKEKEQRVFFFFPFFLFGFLRREIQKEEDE